MRVKKGYKRKFTKYLIKSLLKEKVKNVKIRRGWISFEYDGEKIRNKIVMRKHEGYVGSWARTKNKVYVDDDVKNKKDVHAIALHESIEKFITQKYGLPEDIESHEIATVKEREFLKKIGGDWRKHERLVEKVWEKEGKK
jgi:hypothetical protein